MITYLIEARDRLEIVARDAVARYAVARDSVIDIGGNEIQMTSVESGCNEVVTQEPVRRQTLIVNSGRLLPVNLSSV